MLKDVACVLTCDATDTMPLEELAADRWSFQSSEDKLPGDLSGSLVTACAWARSKTEVQMREAAKARGISVESIPPISLTSAH